MATLLTLVEQGRLIKVDPALGPRELESRNIYAFPHVIDWFSKTLPNLGSTWKLEVSPQEQVDALIGIFCSDQILTYDWHFKPLSHIQDGIWELKTPDVRIFGWFFAKDIFIGTDADAAERIKQLKMYRPYREQAVRFRDKLDLDEPKFVPGKDPQNVVSDFDYP